MNSISNLPKGTISIILVAALGYFVDIYDLVLFGMERQSSLTDILSHTLPNEEHSKIPELVKTIGIKLFNYQMIGMLIGGIFWGILGDKKGRLSVLFGSILTYSVANILNGMVTDTDTYALMRFISGFGLAGELGAGITLVAEVMPKETRGYGAMIVASIGLFGAVVAGIIGKSLGDWRMSYYVGGGMGLALLLLRIGVYESGMYDSAKKSEVSKGNFFSLFYTKKNLFKYLNVILIAMPVWYVMGILITLSPEIGKSMGMKEVPVARDAITIAYVGITIGDVFSGWMSQKLKSRKKALLFFISLTILFSIAYFIFAAKSLFAFYTVTILIGFATGYWAVFMSAASELFGTNIRATVTTTAPNFVRGSVTIMALVNSSIKPSVGLVYSSIYIGIVVFILAFLANYFLEETFSKDLNYTEK